MEKQIAALNTKIDALCAEIGMVDATRQETGEWLEEARARLIQARDSLTQAVRYKARRDAQLAR